MFEVGQKVKRKFDGTTATVHNPKGCGDLKCLFGNAGCVLVIRDGSKDWEPWPATQTQAVEA